MSATTIDCTWAQKRLNGLNHKKIGIPENRKNQGKFRWVIKESSVAGLAGIQYYIGLVLACLLSGSTDVTASPSRCMTQLSGIPILSSVLIMHVGNLYIPPEKFLIYLSCLLFYSHSDK